jgi:predicted dehydrogenase
MLDAEPGIVAVCVTSPTPTHFAIARDSLLAGRHVMLEKPPTATLGELLELERIATERKLALVTSFHARHNTAVERMREILWTRRAPERVVIEWLEDFDRWHAGQTWPWGPGGFGVFDAGINALSILCHVLPNLEFRVESARFRVPPWAVTPACAELVLTWEDSGTGHVAFEWRNGGDDVWDISIRGADEAGRTEALVLRGARMLLRDGTVAISSVKDEEYAGVYRDFAEAARSRARRVSISEMRIIEDATLLANVESSKMAF